jgi:RNA binding exosome subunit
VSSRVPIAYLDIRVFAHATEDHDKVLTAVRNLLPSEFLEKVEFRTANLTGYHGNPIVLYSARIKEKDAVQKVFEKIASGISILDKELLGNEIGQHMDSGNLYLRLDKQSAYFNELRFQQTDPIHLKIHFKKHKPEEIVEICRKAGLLP